MTGGLIIIGFLVYRVGRCHDPAPGIPNPVLLPDNNPDRNDRVPDPYLENGEGRVLCAIKQAYGKSRSSEDRNR
jgi:hypothetical protein